MITFITHHHDTQKTIIHFLHGWDCWILILEKYTHSSVRWLSNTFSDISIANMFCSSHHILSCSNFICSYFVSFCQVLNAFSILTHLVPFCVCCCETLYYMFLYMYMFLFLLSLHNNIFQSFFKSLLPQHKRCII
jgi:hypothetical protein